MKRIRKRQSHRYYCQNVLKDIYPVDGIKKTIDLPYQKFDDIPQPDRWYVGELIRYGYLVQYKLLSIPEAKPVAKQPRIKQQPATAAKSNVNQLRLL